MSHETAHPAAASSRTAPPVLDPGLPTFSRRAAAAFVLAILPVVGTVAAIAWANMRTLRGNENAIIEMLALCTVGSIAGFFVAISARRHMKPDERGRLLAALAIPVAVIASLWGMLLVFLSTVSFTRGRQLRERGAPVLARLVPGALWLETGAPVDAPAKAADAWRENGKTEHASVAAFSHLSSELMALGAPASLIEAAHKDALDEMQHARLCFSLALAIDGNAFDPGPLVSPMTLPSISRTARLARLAVESLVDGALNEGTSARTVARLVPLAKDERVRAVLVAIAGDEGRHASHGYDVLAWCLDTGGLVVRAAVAGAVRALPDTIGASLYPAADDGSLEVHGIPGRALQLETYRAVRADVVMRTRALLGIRRAAAA